MTIGLIILGVLAILIFFGVTERFFRKIGIANWIAFLLVLALVIGALIPNIVIRNMVSINVSGFIIPFVIMIILAALIGWNKELARAMLAVVAVAGIAVAVRMLIKPTNISMIVTASVVVGFVGGAIAYLVGQTRLSTLVATMGGIVIGDLIVGLINRFALGGTNIALGASGVFDSIIIASIFGIILVEAIAGMRGAMNRNRISETNLNMESGQDVHITKALDYKDKEDKEEYVDYFNDDID